MPDRLKELLAEVEEAEENSSLSQPEVYPLSHTARAALPDALYALVQCRYALDEAREWYEDTGLCPVCDCREGDQHATGCWIPLALEALAAIEAVGEGGSDG